MEIKNSIRLVVLSGILCTMMVSCAYGPGHAHVGASFYYPYGYYYYPSVRVYFHYPTGYYFYLSGNTWIRTRVLPPNIHLSPAERVHLDINSSKPYLYNKQHREEYKPRPNYRPSVEKDREERNKNRLWYEEQKEYKKEKRFKDRDR